MSKSVLQKVFALACICILSFGLYQYGRFFSDYIVDDYALDFSGSDGASIVLKRNDALDLILVDSRVDEYKFDSTAIYVSRTPKILSAGEGGITTYKLSSKCEYWVIDRPTHAVKKVEFLPNVKCLE